MHGTPDAITYTEELQRHLFQRPDATDVKLDTDATSLSGLGATWQIGRVGNVPHWRIAFGGDLRTPGLELNDLGFQQSSDRVVPYLWTQYREDKPSDSVLNWQVNTDVFTVNNFEPTLLDFGWEGNASLMFANYWQFSGSFNYDHALGSDAAARRRHDPRRSDAARLA